jgi:hypothetical protein
MEQHQQQQQHEQEDKERQEAQRQQALRWESGHEQAGASASSALARLMELDRRSAFSGAGAGAGRLAAPEGSRNVRLSGLEAPLRGGMARLRESLRRFGAIESLRLDPSGRKGWALFSSLGAADAALRADASSLFGPGAVLHRAQMPWLPRSVSRSGGDADEEDEVADNSEGLTRRRAARLSWHDPNSIDLEESDASADDAAKDDPNSLLPSERAELTRRLDDLTLSRSSVASCMAFCLDHAHSARECCTLLGKALASDCAPPRLAVARLYLLSDVLYNANAAVRNASAFRLGLQPQVPSAFAALGALRRRCEGRSKLVLHDLDRRVLRVLAAWRDDMLFSDAFLLGLEAAFLGRLEGAPNEAELEPELDEAGLRAEDSLDGLKAACLRDGLCADGDTAALRRRVQRARAFREERSAAIRLVGEQREPRADVDGGAGVAAACPGPVDAASEELARTSSSGSLPVAAPGRAAGGSCSSDAGSVSSASEDYPASIDGEELTAEEMQDLMEASSLDGEPMSESDDSDGPAARCPSPLLPASK